MGLSSEPILYIPKHTGRSKSVDASFHLEGDAVQWFQWYERAQPNLAWELLVKAFCIRFGPTEYKDFDGALFRVQQTRSLREYQTQFERLATMSLVGARRHWWGALLAGSRRSSLMLKCSAPNLCVQQWG